MYLKALSKHVVQASKKRVISKCLHPREASCATASWGPSSPTARSRSTGRFTGRSSCPCATGCVWLHPAWYTQALCIFPKCTQQMGQEPEILLCLGVLCPQLHVWLVAGNGCVTKHVMEVCC